MMTREDIWLSKRKKEKLKRSTGTIAVDFTYNQLDFNCSRWLTLADLRLDCLAFTKYDSQVDNECFFSSIWLGGKRLHCLLCLI